MKSHINSIEFELLGRLETEVRKLKGSQVSVGIIDVIKEINNYRRQRAQIAAEQKKLLMWKPSSEPDSGSNSSATNGRTMAA
ncbi:MAG: hypothetical protein NT159_06420 [Proteobacteria bacterium]|nr:hypothetical protein [Pseudomonadota bacterium]